MSSLQPITLLASYDPGGFRYYSIAGSVPREDATNYRLTIGGLVDRPMTYTLDALRALPQTRIVHDVRCTDGWRVPNIPFEGVRLQRWGTWSAAVIWPSWSTNGRGSYCRCRSSSVSPRLRSGRTCAD